MTLNLGKILDEMLIGALIEVLLASNIEEHVHILGVLTKTTGLILLLYLDLPIITHHEIWYSDSLVVKEVSVVADILLNIPNQRKSVFGCPFLDCPEIRFLRNGTLLNIDFFLLYGFRQLIFQQLVFERKLFVSKYNLILLQSILD